MSNPTGSTSGGLSLVSKWFAGIGLWLMTAIIAAQVFARYVLNDSPAWAEQAALLIMIWYVFIAAAAGVREGFHIRIAVFVDSLPEKLRHAMIIVGHLVVFAFGIGMVWYGIELTQATWGHVIPTLGISRGFAYLPIPLSGLLIAGFSIEHVVAELRSTEVPKLWN